jgi:8-oxo-dGTP pyrophosphatase MutT (NUDIX family)
MGNKSIRVISICLFYNKKRNSILVAEGYDPEKNERFYRPLGGGIMFGEKTKDALKREIEEEISEKIVDIEYIATLENIFTFNGQKGHEIVFVYDAKFKNKTVYDRESFEGYEIEENWGKFKVVWKPIAFFQTSPFPLFPTGLLELIQEKVY